MLGGEDCSEEAAHWAHGLEGSLPLLSPLICFSTSHLLTESCFSSAMLPCFGARDYGLKSL